MLDIKDIKKRKEYYDECFKKREYEVDLDNLINLYDKQNRIKQEQETLLALKNKGAKEFEIAKKNNAPNLQDFIQSPRRKQPSGQPLCPDEILLATRQELTAS